MDAADGVLNWRSFLNAFAPIYFLSFSLLRCYVETAILADQSSFSYYVALHHTLWNATTILIIILLTHLILKVPIARLLWVMYGITLMSIPLFYAMVTGENLSGYMKTIRKQMIELLENKEMSAREISQTLGIREKEIYTHLSHVSRSVNAKREKLIIIPAECLGCGYVFEKRERFTRPGRCPQCKSEHIQNPIYRIG